MLSLQRMQEKHREQVLQLEVHPDQVKFVGEIEEILANESKQVLPHVMVDDGQVVGFFLIDLSYPQHYEFASSNSLGLRAYFVGRQFQGKGYGTLGVQYLLSFLQETYSDYHAVYLTVNCKNPAAFQCYLKAGFVDTEELYLGGDAGPQHIMKRAL